MREMRNRSENWRFAVRPAAMLMGLIVWLVGRAAIHWELPSGARLVLLVLLGAAIYVALVRHEIVWLARQLRTRVELETNA